MRDHRARARGLFCCVLFAIQRAPIQGGLAYRGTTRWRKPTKGQAGKNGVLRFAPQLYQSICLPGSVRDPKDMRNGDFTTFALPPTRNLTPPPMTTVRILASPIFGR